MKFKEHHEGIISGTYEPKGETWDQVQADAIDWEWPTLEALFELQPITRDKESQF